MCDRFIMASQHSQTPSQSLPPKITYQDTTLYDLGNDIYVFVSSFNGYAPKVGVRKFLKSQDGKGVYPSIDGFRIDLKNLDFLISLLNKTQKAKLSLVKQKLMNDHQYLVEVAELKRKRNIEEIN